MSWFCHGLGRPDAAVVNDQIGPAVDPAVFVATICQKYVVLPVSVDGAYEADDCALDTLGGGFAVPNLTSYVVALVALHVSVGVVLTLVAPFAGLGLAGAPGGGGGEPAVVNDHTGPGVDPFALR